MFILEEMKFQNIDGKTAKNVKRGLPKNKLKDEHELQSYFINRIGKFLEKKGKKIIGWDEIIEGGIPHNAVIQSWRGIEGGLIAAKNKHYAIMSPTSHCYFDYDLEAINLEKYIHLIQYLPALTPTNINIY